MYNFMFENSTRVYFGDHMDQLGETLKQYGDKVLPYVRKKASM